MLTFFENEKLIKINDILDFMKVKRILNPKQRTFCILYARFSEAKHVKTW